ncbi:15325_t:CDS:2 [Funneliformis geosporum]|nr:15325_t:CDS:2 [Funneliformis geosporum]
MIVNSIPLVLQHRGCCGYGGRCGRCCICIGYKQPPSTTAI